MIASPRIRLFLVTATAGLVVAGTALAGPDPLRGAWVSVDPDGSITRVAFSAPGPDGVRNFILVDSYSDYCALGGPGTGSGVTGHGTAVVDGTHVTITIMRTHCANGAPGAFPPPLEFGATLHDGILDYGDGVYAVRAGKGEPAA